jgi:hypothetical protein
VLPYVRPVAGDAQRGCPHCLHQRRSAWLARVPSATGDHHALCALYDARMRVHMADRAVLSRSIPTPAHTVQPGV